MDDLRTGHVAVLATRMLAQSALPDAPVVAVRTLAAEPALAAGRGEPGLLFGHLWRRANERRLR
jgi:hypothetical protein